MNTRKTAFSAILALTALVTGSAYAECPKWADVHKTASNGADLIYYGDAIAAGQTIIWLKSKQSPISVCPTGPKPPTSLKCSSPVVDLGGGQYRWVGLTEYDMEVSGVKYMEGADAKAACGEPKANVNQNYAPPAK